MWVVRWLNHTHSTNKGLCKTRALKMTWELQSNSALKMTFEPLFFKCGLAENSGVKVELSSRFLAWRLESGGQQQPCRDTVYNHRIILIGKDLKVIESNH